MLTPRLLADDSWKLEAGDWKLTNYFNDSIMSSSAFLGGRTRSRGSVARGSSTTLRSSIRFFCFVFT